VLNVENWAEMRRLHRGEGIPIKAIARLMGCSKNTVKKALTAESPPRYQRAPGGSIVDAVEPQIRELLQAYPTMPATVIAERIGWDRSNPAPARWDCGVSAYFGHRPAWDVRSQHGCRPRAPLGQGPLVAPRGARRPWRSLCIRAAGSTPAGRTEVDPSGHPPPRARAAGRVRRQCSRCRAVSNMPHRSVGSLRFPKEEHDTWPSRTADRFGPGPTAHGRRSRTVQRGGR
jgi:hypothetical protein